MAPSNTSDDVWHLQSYYATKPCYVVTTPPPNLTIDRTIFEMWMVYPPTKRGPSEGRRVNGKGN